MWVEFEKGQMPEDVLPIHKIETNGHQFIDAVTGKVYVTDKFKEEKRIAIRKHVTHPAFGSDWYWEVNGPKFDGFQPLYWSVIKVTMKIQELATPRFINENEVQFQIEK